MKSEICNWPICCGAVWPGIFTVTMPSLDTEKFCAPCGTVIAGSTRKPSDVTSWP